MFPTPGALLPDDANRRIPVDHEVEGVALGAKGGHEGLDVLDGAGEGIPGAVVAHRVADRVQDDGPPSAVGGELLVTIMLPEED
jgi:hypothetical protein